MPVNFIYNSNVDDFADNIGEELARAIIHRALILTSMQVLRGVKIRSPVDHGGGGLSGSWQLVEEDGNTIKISTSKYYALFHHTGTGQYFNPPDDGFPYGPSVGAPYPIYPVNKQALFWPGATHPVKSVMHPGIPRNPYITDSLKEAEDLSTDFLLRALKETIDV